jgi:hypothetical protein
VRSQLNKLECSFTLNQRGKFYILKVFSFSPIVLS